MTMAEEVKGSFRITHVTADAPAGSFIADTALYETRDGRVVGEGDPDAHSLIAAAGGVINGKTAARLGIKGGTGQYAAKPAKAQAEVPSEVADAPREQRRASQDTGMGTHEKYLEQEPKPAKAQADVSNEAEEQALKPQQAPKSVAGQHGSVTIKDRTGDK
jgi:hypothetical protein